MLGIDLTKISRFKDPSEALIKRILHPNEIKEYLNSKNKALFLARHWAIKEALYKSNNQLKSFNKIELQKKDRQYTFPGYIISTTKEADYYLAIVIKEKDEFKN